MNNYMDPSKDYGVKITLKQALEIAQAIKANPLMGSEPEQEQVIVLLNDALAVAYRDSKRYREALEKMRCQHPCAKEPEQPLCPRCEALFQSPGEEGK